MDLGRPLIQHPDVAIGAVRDALRALAPEDWTTDRADRVALAGARPGDAIFLYNDMPATFERCTLEEAQATGSVHVLRHAGHALFAPVTQLIETAIAPLYPDCDVLRVQIADLPAGAAIKRHRDVGILAAIHRLHVPIATSDAVVFEIDDRPFRLVEGILYELNNVVAHAVRNDGTDGRLHLLVDMLPRSIGRCVYHDDKRSMAVAVIRARGLGGRR